MKPFPVTGNKVGYRKPIWMDIADRYPADRDCLAAFIAFESAEVLDGVKPSSLINLTDRPRRCGRNLCAIWKEHGEEILRESPLEFRVMAERPGSLLVLFYDRAALERLLANRGVVAILDKAGYLGARNIDGLLTAFANRFGSGGVPHEIGLILGYPLKDVAGFMGLGRLRFSCQGPWRIYGNPLESLRLAESHRQCRCRMAGRLMAGCVPYECLGCGGGGSVVLQDGVFCHPNENEGHY